MLRHRISAEVIAAVLCFCLGGMCLGFCLLFFEDYNYSGSTRISTEEALATLVFMALSGLTIASGVGYLRKRRWAAIIMTVISVLLLAFVIIAILFNVNSFTNSPTDGLFFLFVGIGIPLFIMLFFSSVTIFPWMEKDKSELHENLLDQL